MKNFSILLACLCLLCTVPSLKAADAEPLVNGAAMPDESAKSALNAAVAEYNALSKKEKKSRFREAKKLFHAYKSDKKTENVEGLETNQILLAILAIILPPLAIYLKERELTWKFWASLGLMVTGIIFLSALPFMWIIAAGLALLVVFDVL